MRRILLATVALSLPVAAVLLAVGEPAGAIGVTTTCRTITGTVGGTFVFDNCTGASTGGTSIAMNTSSFFQSGGTIDWADGNTTTVSSQTLGGGKKLERKCAAKFGFSPEASKVVGVVSGSDTGESPIPGMFKAKVCADASGNVHALGPVTIT